MLITSILLAILLLEPVNQSTVDFTNQGSDWTMDSCNPITNTAQSPINIITSTVIANNANQIKLNFNSNTKYVTLSNIGFTLQADGDWLTIEIQNLKGKTRKFVGNQFHTHTRSDHSIDGVYYDLELHIVCTETLESKAQNGGDNRNVIALGLLFKVSNNYSPFYTMVDSSQQNQKLYINAYNGLYGILFEKEKLLKIQNKQLGYWLYEGALTTPPCSETVYHVIIDQIFDISQEQVNAFRNVFKDNSKWGNGNYRVVQSLNGRTVHKGTVSMIKMTDSLVLQGWISSILKLVLMFTVIASYL